MFTTAKSRWSRAARTISIIAIAGTALSLAACSSSGGSKATSTTLTIASNTGPTSLDPTLAGNGVPLTWYTTLAYDSLIKRSVDGKAEPGLATDWAYSADRLSFVLNLRKDVQFSDGSKMTAQVVADWLMHYKKSGQFTAQLASVKSADVTGPLQVTLKLSTLDPLLPYALDQSGIAGDVVGAAGLADSKALGSSTVGAGPYMLDKSATIANSSYVFVKNPHYWNPKTQYYKKIVIKVITDQNSILSALRSGQVQVALGSATNAAAAKSAGLNVDAATSAMVGMYIGDIDGTIVPALKDVRVRQALNYAIDRKAITKSIYGDYGTATDQYVPKGVGGHVDALEDVYPYDPAKAKSLLAEAGFAKGFSFTLVEQPGIDSGDLLAQAMVQDWKAIGVDVTLKAIPAFSDYVTALFSKKYPATTFNFNYSTQLTDTQQLVTNPAVYNFLGYTDAKANALAVEQRKYDIESPEGIKAAEDSETYMVNGAYTVPVSSISAVMFSTKAVTGVAFKPAFVIPDPTRWKPAN